MENRIRNSMESFHITESNVLRAIDRMNAGNKIYPRVLKETKLQISKSLCILFNKFLIDGKVPSDWKCANVTPIFKKVGNLQPANYRPSSLLSVVYTLVERIIRDNIV